MTIKQVSSSLWCINTHGRHSQDSKLLQSYQYDNKKNARSLISQIFGKEQTYRSSCGSEVKVHDLCSTSLGSVPTGIHMSHWWQQEGTRPKLLPCASNGAILVDTSEHLNKGVGNFKFGCLRTNMFNKLLIKFCQQQSPYLQRLAF